MTPGAPARGIRGRKSRFIRPVARSVLLVFLCCVATYSAADDPPLQVVASVLEPCVIESAGQPSGFSIELWRALAEQAGIDYEISIQPFAEMLSLVGSGRADVAIGCISVIGEREAALDFTHPIADGGLLAASIVDQGIVPRFSARSEKMLLVLMGLLGFFAHLMWWSERGRDAISDRYFPGIFQSLWFCVVTMSTVGYGDVTPQRWLGRVAAALVIVLGVSAFGVIFGQFAADAERSSAAHPVESPNDLRRYRVATKTNTVSASFLLSQGVRAAEFPSLAEAVAAMRAGTIDLIVHDAVAIQYLVQQNADLIQAGPAFGFHHLGFALPQDSRWREPINSALLQLRASGLHEAIRNRWFYDP